MQQATGVQTVRTLVKGCAQGTSLQQMSRLVLFAAAAASALAAVVHLPTLWYSALCVHPHMSRVLNGCKEKLTLHILTAQPDLNDASVRAEIVKRHWELAVAVHGSDAAALDAGAFGVAHRMICSLFPLFSARTHEYNLLVWPDDESAQRMMVQPSSQALRRSRWSAPLKTHTLHSTATTWLSSRPAWQRPKWRTRHQSRTSGSWSW